MSQAVYTPKTEHEIVTKSFPLFLLTDERTLLVLPWLPALCVDGEEPSGSDRKIAFIRSGAYEDDHDDDDIDREEIERWSGEKVGRTPRRELARIS